MKLDPQKVGVATGLFLGLFHALWSLLVMLGLAQQLLNFIYYLHFLTNPFVVTGFSLMTALILVGFTAIVGYAMGYSFGVIWNKWGRTGLKK